MRSIRESAAQAWLDMEEARQQLQQGGDLAGSVKALTASAESLRQIEERVPAQTVTEDLSPKPTKAAGGGRPESEFLGRNAPLGETPNRDTRDFLAKANLRFSHIPTGHIHAYDEKDYPLVTFDLQNNSNAAVRLCVQSYVEGYSARAVNTLDLDKDGEGKEKKVQQLPTFFPSALESIHDATRAMLRVEVYDLDSGDSSGRLINQQTFRVWLLPRNTTILSQKDPETGEELTLYKYLAGWVTENEPAVRATLRESVEASSLDKFDAYLSRSKDVVNKQVEGMFKSLQQRGLKYIHSYLANGMENAFLQRVRLPKESLETRSANCIDFSVLYASLMGGASLNACLVIIPGHAFVGWQVDPGKTASSYQDELSWYKDPNAWQYLEATMTPSSPFGDAQNAGNKLMQDYRKPTVLNIGRLRREGIFPIA